MNLIGPKTTSQNQTGVRAKKTQSAAPAIGPGGKHQCVNCASCLTPWPPHDRAAEHLYGDIQVSNMVTWMSPLCSILRILLHARPLRRRSGRAMNGQFGDLDRRRLNRRQPSAKWDAGVNSPDRRASPTAERRPLRLRRPPHVDRAERGLEAVDLIVRTIRGDSCRGQSFSHELLHRLQPELR
jgi:hypothetical protein